MGASARIGKGGRGRPTSHAGGSGLLGAGNFSYVGSFRLPQDLGTSHYGFQFYGYQGTGGAAYNPANNSLFMTGSAASQTPNDIGAVCEISIPTLVPGNNPAGGSTNLAQLNPAGFIQNFVDITNGKLAVDPYAGAGQSYMYGLLVLNGRLYCSVGLKFDNQGLVNFCSHSLTLTTNDFFGWETVRDPAVSASESPAMAVGMLIGNLSDVPASLVSSVGGTVIGSSFYGISIISRTSWGPSAIVFNASDIGGDTPSSQFNIASSSPVTAKALVYYSSNHPTLGLYDDSALGFNRRSPVKQWWSWIDHAAGGIIEDQTYFIVKQTGVGHATNPLTNLDTNTQYYGAGTDNWALNGVDDVDGQHTFAYDPDAVGKISSHGWPNKHVVEAYRLADVIAARSGANPWDAIPYAQWELPLPFDHDLTSDGIHQGTRTAYDRANRLLYVVQVDSIDFVTGFFPMVHVYHISSSL